MVLIAAGFDTRAYRLHSPAVTFFEVDLPHASSKKQQLVQKLKLLPAEVRRCPLAVRLSEVALHLLLRILQQTATGITDDGASPGAKRQLLPSNCWWLH